jgi:uncharacterized protein DUF3606
MLREDVKEGTKNQSNRTHPAASHEREIQEWAKNLGIAPGRLKQAVAAVGITPRKIREYLRKNQ